MEHAHTYICLIWIREKHIHIYVCYNGRFVAVETIFGRAFALRVIATIGGTYSLAFYEELLFQKLQSEGLILPTQG